MASVVGDGMRLAGTIIMTYPEAIRKFSITLRLESRILQHSPKGCMLKQTRLRISAHVTLSLVVRREARF